LYIQRKFLLDVFKCRNLYLGVYREPFTRVMELTDLELISVEGASEIWRFRQTAGGLRGRLIDVVGYLHDDPISLNGHGRTYMVTRQDYTLALLFPGSPFQINLNEARHKELNKEEKTYFPSSWPPEMVSRVIRYKWKNIIILDEAFLLKQIGLRAGQ